MGLTERFEETFALIRRVLRLRLPFYVTRNVGFPLEPSARAIELIRERKSSTTSCTRSPSNSSTSRSAAEDSSFGLEVAAYRAMRPISRAVGSGRAEDFLRRLPPLEPPGITHGTGRSKTNVRILHSTGAVRLLPRRKLSAAQETGS